MHAGCLPVLDLADRDAVHLWQIDLAAPAFAPLAAEASDESANGLLQADEIARAARLARTVDRRRYLIGRSVLRLILAGYCGAAPSELRLVPGPHGKPMLAAPQPRVPIHFNLAHSDNLAVLAVAPRPVGVDVEIVQPLPDLADLIEHYFAPPEQRALAALSGAARLDAFYRIWTRKEAWLKLGGEGLTRDPATIAVTHTRPARLLWVAETAQSVTDWAVTDWVLVDLALDQQTNVGAAQQAVGALAVQGAAPAITWHTTAVLQGRLQDNRTRR